MPEFSQEVRGVNQHAAATAGRVVDGVARLRLKDPDQGVDHLRRGEEFARLCACVVGKLFDQVLVCSSQDVRRNTIIREVDLIEVLRLGRARLHSG